MEKSPFSSPTTVTQAEKKKNVCSVQQRVIQYQKPLFSRTSFRTLTLFASLSSSFSLHGG